MSSSLVNISERWIINKINELDERIKYLEVNQNKTINKYYDHTKIICACEESKSGSFKTGYLFSNSKHPTIQIIEYKGILKVEAQQRCLDNAIGSLAYIYTENKIVIVHNFDFDVESYIKEYDIQQEKVIINKEETDRDIELTNLYNKLLNDLE